MNSPMRYTDVQERREELASYLTGLYCLIYDIMAHKHCGNIKQRALGLTLNNGNPHYHVSYERALVVVPKIIKGKDVSYKWDERFAMWQEIATRAAALCAICQISMAKALEIVIYHYRASRFFMKKRHAWNIIKRQLYKNHIKKDYGPQCI